MEDNLQTSIFTLEQSNCLRYVCDNIVYALAIDGHASNLFEVLHGACNILDRDPVRVSSARHHIAQIFAGVSVARIGQLELSRFIGEISAAVSSLHCVDSGSIVHGVNINSPAGIGGLPKDDVLPLPLATYNDQPMHMQDNETDAVMEERPLCQLCTCKKCQKRVERARKKGKRQSSIQAAANSFAREDLFDVLDGYWLTLQTHGLYSDQFCQRFQSFVDISNSDYEQCQYHLILRHLDVEDEFYTWRRFVAEYRNLKSYMNLQKEVTRQRVDNMQVRERGESDRNRSHKQYVKRMFPHASLETLSEELAAFKKALVFGRRWEILIEGYTEKDGTEIPGLGLGVLFVHGPEISKKMSTRLALLGGREANRITRYSTTNFDHSYLKSLLKRIWERQPNIARQCLILGPTAESLIRNHKLSKEDDWDAVFKQLEKLS